MDSLPDIAPFQHRLDELDAQMAEPSFYANQRKAADVTREQQWLRRLVEDYGAHARLEREITEHAALLKDPSAEADPRQHADQPRDKAAPGVEQTLPCASRAQQLLR